jgi:hypothetical protein
MRLVREGNEMNNIIHPDMYCHEVWYMFTDVFKDVLMGLALKCSEINKNFVPCLLYVWVHMHTPCSVAVKLCALSVPWPPFRRNLNTLCGLLGSSPL